MQVLVKNNKIKKRVHKLYIIIDILLPVLGGQIEGKNGGCENIKLPQELTQLVFHV